MPCPKHASVCRHVYRVYLLGFPDFKGGTPLYVLYTHIIPITAPKVQILNPLFRPKLCTWTCQSDPGVYKGFIIGFIYFIIMGFLVVYICRFIYI